MPCGKLALGENSTEIMSSDKYVFANPDRYI